MGADSNKFQIEKSSQLAGLLLNSLKSIVSKWHHYASRWVDEALPLPGPLSVTLESLGGENQATCYMGD